MISNNATDWVPEASNLGVARDARYILGIVFFYLKKLIF